MGPSIGWATHITVCVIKLRDDSRTMLEMMRKPDEHGFGSGYTNRIIEDNTRAMHALTHYIQWLVREQTGAMPPPPLNPVGTSLPEERRT